MKNLIIGLIIGGLGTWVFFATIGKKHITVTEKKVVIETNWVEKTETRYFNETKWTTLANIVWVTNIVEQVAKVAPVVPVAAPVPAVVQQPVQATQHRTEKSMKDGFNETRPASGVKINRGSRMGNAKHTGIKRDFDGSIITNQ